MGDARRFDFFGGYLADRFPDRALRIADVAGGKGYLRSTLFQRGYLAVTTIDRRNSNAKGRPGTKWGHFIWDKTQPEYDVVAGMHPDGATDHIIRYAGLHRVPFVVCPCCIVPSADVFWGQHTYQEWLKHLVLLAQKYGLEPSVHHLPMNGRNLVITGVPQ